MPILVITFLVLAMSSPFAQEPQPDARTLWGLTECAAPNRALELQAAYQTKDEWKPLVEGIHRCEDLALASAVTASASNDDLKSAVENFYRKDRVYIEALSSRGSPIVAGVSALNFAVDDRSRALLRARRAAARAGLM